MASRYLPCWPLRFSEMALMGIFEWLHMVFMAHWSPHSYKPWSDNVGHMYIPVAWITIKFAFPRLSFAFGIVRSSEIYLVGSTVMSRSWRRSTKGLSFVLYCKTSVNSLLNKAILKGEPFDSHWRWSCAHLWHILVATTMLAQTMTNTHGQGRQELWSCGVPATTSTPRKNIGIKQLLAICSKLRWTLQMAILGGVLNVCW